MTTSSQNAEQLLHRAYLENSETRSAYWVAEVVRVPGQQHPTLRVAYGPLHSNNGGRSRIAEDYTPGAMRRLENKVALKLKRGYEQMTAPENYPIDAPAITHSGAIKMGPVPKPKGPPLTFIPKIVAFV